MKKSVAAIIRRIGASRNAAPFAVAAAAVLLSLATVAWQARSLGLPYLEEYLQIERHTAVIQGTAGNPWQYRVLSEYISEGLIRLFQGVGVPHAVAAAFIFLRVLQNILIFLAAFAYYRAVGLPAAHGFAGLGMLSWSMLTSLYNSDLSFNTYFDVLFFLLAGLAILGQKPLWILPLSVLAAFNRETGVLIPLMLMAVQLRRAPGKQRNAALGVGALSLAINLAVFFGLRIVYGPQEMVLSFVGLSPGAEVLSYNLLRPLTWVILINMTGIAPLLAPFSYPGWRPELKTCFWVVVPIWLFVHAVASIMAECRVFLVPQAMFFIPGALLVLHSSGNPPPAPADRFAPNRPEPTSGLRGRV
ncbi:MAG: hypothetical protein JW929_03740 [Anaerolineales bacterium]|nr:hypothetical protein [Anaerolineales bacterium]